VKKEQPTEAPPPGSPTALREMCKKELAVWAHGQRLALARHRVARDACEANEPKPLSQSDVELRLRLVEESNESKTD